VAATSARRTMLYRVEVGILEMPREIELSAREGPGLGINARRWGQGAFRGLPPLRFLERIPNTSVAMNRGLFKYGLDGVNVPAEEPMVRRLSPGGRWIRTIGSAKSSAKVIDRPTRRPSD